MCAHSPSFQAKSNVSVCSVASIHSTFCSSVARMCHMPAIARALAQLLFINPIDKRKTLPFNKQAIKLTTHTYNGSSRNSTYTNLHVHPCLASIFDRVFFLRFYCSSMSFFHPIRITREQHIVQKSVQKRNNANNKVHSLRVTDAHKCWVQV